MALPAEWHKFYVCFLDVSFWCCSAALGHVSLSAPGVGSIRQRVFLHVQTETQLRLAKEDMEKAKNRANSMEGSLKEAQERSQLSEEDLIQVTPGCSSG